VQVSASLVTIAVVSASRAIATSMNSLSNFHPFRSLQARDAYLAHYDRRAGDWPVPSECRLIATADGQTFVRISGPASAPPLVLLPGVNSTSLMWQPNIAELAHSFRVYAVDNIYDFGRSIWRRPMRTEADLVRWLDDLFAALGLHTLNLCGISYGGWIASRYALRRQERLQKLVLLAPVFTVLPLRLEFIARALLCLIPLRTFTKRFVYWLSDDSVSRGGDQRQLVDLMVDDAFIGLTHFKRHQPVRPDILSDAELASIAIPTLYLVGENEKLNSATDAVARLNRVAPQIETVVIGGAGHDLTIAQADTVNRLILAFLAQTTQHLHH